MRIIATDIQTSCSSLRSSVEPAIFKAWPELQFYGYDQGYPNADLGYAGPHFSYAPMPDQYVFQTIQQKEREPGHKYPEDGLVDHQNARSLRAGQRAGHRPRPWTWAGSSHSRPVSRRMITMRRRRPDPPLG